MIESVINARDKFLKPVKLIFKINHKTLLLFNVTGWCNLAFRGRTIPDSLLSPVGL